MYFGISYNMDDLSGNQYSNFLIGGAVELVFCISVVPLMRFVGRRTANSIFLVIGGIVCITNVILSTSDINGRSIDIRHQYRSADWFVINCVSRSMCLSKWILWF